MNLTIRGTFNPVGDKSWQITGALSYPLSDCRDMFGICVIVNVFLQGLWAEVDLPSLSLLIVSVISFDVWFPKGFVATQQQISLLLDTLKLNKDPSDTFRGPSALLLNQVNRRTGGLALLVHVRLTIPPSDTVGGLKEAWVSFGESTGAQDKSSIFSFGSAVDVFECSM